MIPPLTQRQVERIARSFKKVCETGDIDNLTNDAYKFIMLSSGFIAHYNLFGFREVYRDVSELMRDIEQNADYNRWLNFRPGDQNYDYYHQKAEIYAELVKFVKTPVSIR